MSAVAWLVTHQLAMPEMRLGILTADRPMDEMESMPSPGPAAAVAAVALFLAVWVAMMVAMMFPALAPVVSTFDRWRSRTGRAATVTGVFVAGYVLVWSAVGLLAYAAVVALQKWVPVPGDTAIRAGGFLLVAAGAYQFSPLKATCLRFCRSPLGFFAQYAGELTKGHAGPLRVGLTHGTYCVGCCWCLMVVLVLLGMMNAAWMALVAAVIFVEKVVPYGPLAGRVAGIALVACGLAVVISPDLPT